MNDKLLLLKNTKVISEESFLGSGKATSYLCEYFQIDENHMQLGMLILHLARAYDRIIKDCPVTHGLDQDIFNEIKSSDDFDEVLQINKHILGFFNLSDAPIAENSFFLANIYGLLCNSRQYKEAV